MITTIEQDLFGTTDAPPEQLAGLYVDVVFDRPLDQAYSYAVPEPFRDLVAVGKRLKVPFGRGDKATIGFCVRVTETAPQRQVKELLQVLDDEALLTPDLLRLTRWMADYYLCGWGQVLNAVIPAGAKDQAGTRATAFVEAIPEAELPQPVPTLSPKQAELLRHLRAAGRPIQVRQLAKLAGCGQGPIDAVLDKGLARRVLRRVEKFNPTAEEHAEPEGPVTLNADQLRVWAPVEEAVRRGGFQAFLLYGVTGSGKTEIYLRAIEEVLRQGKQALVLVPEISLTPQTIQRFRGRCGEVAVLHSHLGDAERGGHWRRVAGGQARVIVGARSAVFAPTRNLGLVVIDEEHENTFKQEATPRYHARDVAVMRARLENVPILLGSATPALESWQNAQRGQYTLLTLPNRVLDRPLPQVALIDLRHEGLGRGRPHALSPSLERAMRDALRNKGQVMLLLNRRGFSTHIHCPACGYVAGCKFCDLALTHHRQRAVMLCHYCGYEQPPPERCPNCREETVRYQGLGTEKLQAEVEEKFPGFVVRRMDSDTMRRPGSHARTLAAFRKGLIHVLVGTQMIAKGLDFPNVTLVGVVNADIALHFPDFRAPERTFQLLSQVAGRAGRGPKGGRVLVQTYNPEHACVAQAAAHDYAGFVAAELAQRKAHNYPPFERLARLIVRSRDEQQAADFADKLAVLFQSCLRARAAVMPPVPAVRLLGPAEAPVFRLKGYYRYHFQLQSASSAALHEVLRAVLPAVRTPSGVEYTVDVDPLSML